MRSVGKRVRSSSVDKAEEKKVAKGMMGHDEHIRRVTKQRDGARSDTRRIRAVKSCFMLPAAAVVTGRERS